MSDNQKYSILFLCAHPIGSVEKSVCASALVDIDWQELLALAKKQGMMALLYGHLKYHELLDTIPDFAQKALHRFFVLNVARNERLQKILFDVLSLLQTAKIDVTPIKGIVLAKELYGDIAWRTMEDLDLLVQLPDMLRAREVLLKNGFIDSLNIRDADITEYIDAGWDLSFLHQDSRIIIEIGTGISPRYMGGNIFDSELLDNKQEVLIYDNYITTLSPESQLLLLCIHGTKHHWNRIIWLADLVALLRAHPGIDFVLVEKFARKMGVWRMVLTSLCLINILFDIDLPAVIKDTLTKDKHAEKLASWLALRISAFNTLTSWQYRKFYILTLDRMWGKARYLIDLTFSPTFNDWKVVELPHYLRPLYYVIRPFRMVGSWVNRQKVRRSLRASRES